MIKVSLYRKKANLTQQDMADYLGISRNSYYLKENGKIDFKDVEKIKIQHFINSYLDLNLTIDELFF